MTTAAPASANAVMAAAAVGRGASAMPISAAARPSTATHTHRPPGRGHLLPPTRQHTQVDALLVHQPVFPTARTAAGSGASPRPSGMLVSAAIPARTPG